jgi:hypothetical protein
MSDENLTSTPASGPGTEQPADAGPDPMMDFPVPPADFSFLVYSLTTQAQLQLGLLRLDESSAPEPNLPIARHTIDLLAMLQTKTQGNLDLQEKLLLENALTDLRFRYVQLTEQASSAPKADNPSAAGGPATGGSAAESKEAGS